MLLLLVDIILQLRKLLDLVSNNLPSSFGRTSYPFSTHNTRTVSKFGDNIFLLSKTMATLDMLSSNLILSQGSKAQAKWKYGNKWFNVVVKEVNHDGTFALSYEDGDNWENVPANRIRLLDGTMLDSNQPEDQSTTAAATTRKIKGATSGKWNILRKAILSSMTHDNNSAQEVSIHRHDGFHMFEKVVETEETKHIACSGGSSDQGYHVVCYQIPHVGNSVVQLRILERRAGAKLSLTEIAPGKYGHGEGVDNTGNVRVWPAEEVTKQNNKIYKYK
jgi:hypothetical protein